MALFNLRDLQLHDGVETTFGTDESGSFDPTSVRTVVQPKMDPNQQVLDNPAVRQYLANHLDPILGLKSGSKVTFSTALRGTGTAAGDGVAAVGSAALNEGLLLKHALGAENLDTGTDVDTTSTTTTATTTDGSGLTQDSAVLIGGEATPLATVSGNDVTFKRALSAAPADAVVVYGGAMYTLEQALFGSLQMQALGVETGAFRFLGCCGTLKLNQMNPSQLPQIDYEFMTADYTKSLSDTLSTAATYDNEVNAPVVGNASALYIQDYGTTTINKVQYSTMTIDPGTALDTLQSGSGIQGVQDFRRNSTKPIVEVTVNDFDIDWHTQFEDKQAKYLHFQIGSTAGQTALIVVDKAYQVARPVRSAINSQLGIKLKFEAVADTAGDPPIRVILL